MLAIIQGEFYKQEIRVNKKGEQVPVAHVISGDEIVAINKADLSGCKKLQEVSVPVNISDGQYGLYICAAVPDEQEVELKDEKKGSEK